MPARPSTRARSHRRTPTSAPASPSTPSINSRTSRHAASDSASDVVRWAAFSCLLVPVVLVLYGASVGGAAAAALGLAAVTTACRVLLRHSERSAARARTAEPGGRASGRHAGAVAPGRGRRARTDRGRGRGQGRGAHRTGRHSGGCRPGD
ncbi:hypothetical protein [Streptomyces katsurahamanus]|uniref:hypothetical protein n=1 Tax=Streptomyces katsurahamanus TaxID=2577098 RepID=UPI0012954601